MKQNIEKAPVLRRSMTANQMEMISLGGAIGVGLFMGSSSTIDQVDRAVGDFSLHVCWLDPLHCYAGARRNDLC